jgi:biopolymer transport protein ExbB
MHASLFEMWAAVGLFGRVIVGLLALMSIASLATAIDRLLALARANRAIDHHVRAWRAVLAQELPADTRREVYERTVRRSLLATGSALRRGHGILATVGSTAPFVGLVGTVIGIVHAFEHIAAAGQGGVGEVSAGIAEALITTAVGIGVAIPAVWLLNYLTQRTKRLLVDMEVRAEEVAIETLGETRPEARRARVSAQ